MSRSNVLIYSFFFVFILLKPLSAQTHTFGPEKESFSLHAVGGDYVGVNCCPAVAYRVINKWTWTYEELPNEVIVSSVRLRFFAAPHLNPPSHFAFDIHNIQENIDWTSSLGELFDEYPQVIKSGETVTDVNEHEYFEMIANSTENVNFFNAVKNAVNGPNHFICLGFKKPVETGSNGWYDFRPYENYNDMFAPAVDLFIYYELPEYSVQFFNSINGSLNSGSLILNNDLENPLPSGTIETFELLDDVDIRTAELPFIVNWNGSGTTQKHNYWDLGGTNLQYTLHNEYQVTSSTPALQKSTFLSTTSVTIRNLLEWNVIAGGLVELKDPWFYFETNGNWVQSNEFIPYSSPLEIQNNTINSYGGVFLNQSGPPLWNPTYYKVKASQTQDITLYNTGNPSGRSHKFYFRDWNYDPNKISIQTPGSNETAVVFKTADAELSANLKGTNLSKDNDAYYSTSQRTFIKSDDGYLHSVYVSQEKVWYEVSHDNGVTWKIQKDASPVSDWGKNPSIDVGSYYDDPTGFTFYYTVIVW